MGRASGPIVYPPDEARPLGKGIFLKVWCSTGLSLVRGETCGGIVSFYRWLVNGL